MHSRTGRKITNLVLQDAVKRLDNPRGVPPLRRLDCVCNGGGLTTTFRLNLADRAESTRRKGFLEFAKIERI